MEQLPTARELANCGWSVLMGLTRRDRRAVVAILFGLAALAAAIVAARGPAVPERAVFRWPPAELPAGSPTRTWFAPLLLARHVADAIDARVPCGNEPVLAGARGSIVLFATARDAAQRNGLEVVRGRDTGVVVVRVGGVELARFGESLPHTACSLRIHFDGTRWTIERAGDESRTGTVPIAPTVNGLLTQLDIRDLDEDELAVSVRPIPQDSHASTRQTVFRIVAAILLVPAALLALSTAPRRRPSWPRPGRPTTLDGFVVLALGIWLFLCPLVYDDGWIRARQTNYLVSGGFSNMYEHWGTNLPLATWLEWLQRYTVTYSDSLIVHRLPAFVVLLGAWAVCRACLRRQLGRPRGDDAVWWAATLAFVVGAMAFGITLRPEPLIALLAVVVLAVCVSYAREPALDLLLVALLASGIAVTILPSAVLVAAPLILCVPRIVGDARRRDVVSPLSVASILPIASASTLLVAFVDSDVSGRDESTELIRVGGGHGEGVLQELERYGRLSDGGASVLRRLFVALLIAVAVTAVVELRRRPLATRLPSASVLVGLGLLSLTPSKWIWHFGGFIGICAVAVGFEAHRLAAIRVSRPMRTAAALVVVAVALWATNDPNTWGPLDPGQLDWSLKPGIYILAIATAVGSLVISMRWRPVQLIHVAAFGAALASLVVVSIALSAADSVATDGWTAGRQALGGLVGREGCGLASELAVAIPSAAPPSAAPQAKASGARALAVPESGLRARKNLGRKIAMLWQPLPSGPVGVFVGGNLAPDVTLDVIWGRRTDEGVEPLSSGRADLEQAAEGPDAAPWRFVSEDDFPKRPPEAKLVRLVLREPSRRAAVAVTPPVAYSRVSLASIVKRGEPGSLVSPYFFEAMPCAKLIRVANGIAGTPTLVIDWVSSPFMTNFSSPAAGLGDILDLERLPVSPSSDRHGMYLYRVRKDPRDAIAPATGAFAR